MRKWIRGATEIVGVVLFALLFLVFIVQVVARFGFDRPLPWTDEAAVVLYTWAILWGAAFICSDDEHVSFDLLYTGRRARTRRAMALLAALLIGGLFAWALPAVLDYISFMRRERSAVLNLPMHWVFAPFALLVAAVVWRQLRRIGRLLGRNWERALERRS